MVLKHVEAEISTLGFYRVSFEGMDETIAKYLPASLHDLRHVVVGRLEEDGISGHAFDTFTECLIVLAYLDGYGY